jgi:hypothetical protein
MPSYTDKSPGSHQAQSHAQSQQPATGRQTLVEQLYAPAVQQRAATEHGAQQRGGVQLKGGVGAAGDAYERQADDAVASKYTRGPAGKGFDKSLGVSASDLEALCKDLLARGVAAAKGAS